MVEKETLYNFGIIAVIVVCLISVLYIFLLKPAWDETLAQKNFEESRNVFLSRFCTNLGYASYKIEDISAYNGYCFTESSPMVRVISYFRLGWEQKDGSYTFYILEIKK